jgi:glycosyltransferase involved in cell wall biosynthesis
MSRRILLISYHFPPSAAVGGLRIAGFAKYLPRFGWEPFVLTVKERYLDQRDPERLQGLDPERIYRSCRVPKVLNACLGLKALLGRATDLETASQSKPREADREIRGRPCYLAGGWAAVKRRIFAYLSFPDAERNWILPCLAKAAALIKREGIAQILTSGPPHSVHVTGLILKRLTNVKWAADFRDPWMTPHYTKRISPHTPMTIKIETKLENEVFRYADLVLASTERMMATLKVFHRDCGPEKFVHLPNGFDSNYFEALDESEKYREFTLSHMGSLYLGRDPSPVFQAVKELNEEGRLDAAGIRIRLTGNCRYVNGRPTTRLAADYGLGSTVEVIDQIPYREALTMLAKSHIALLLAPDQPYQIPGKVYDYLGTRTPILAVTGQGATADLIHATGSGRSFDPSDVQGIKDYLLALVKNGVSSAENSPAVMDFEKKILIKNLAERLDRLSFPPA